MSEDIVTKLRVGPVGRLTLDKAASTIEALRGEVARTDKAARAFYEKADAITKEADQELEDLHDALKVVLARAEKAEAEAERLKAALQDCVDAYDFVIVNEYDRGWSSVSDAIHFARKALAGKTT